MKKKSIVSGVICGLIYILFYYFLIMIMFSYLDEVLPDNETNILFLIYMMLFFLMYWFSELINVIIHEAGHLVFGLITGYKFLSFRVLNLFFYKKDKKICLKKYNLVGSSGQCLMMPPDFDNGKIPFVLYNLGGVILNIIFTCCFILIYYYFRNIKFVSTLIELLILLGGYCILINGIPLNLKLIDNDCKNVVTMFNNDKAIYGYWLQTKCNGMLLEGIGLKELPKEWFLVPKDNEMNDSLSASIVYLMCCRLISEHKFKEANKKIKRWLGLEIGLCGVHRNVLLCEQIFCKLMCDDGKFNPEDMMNKEVKFFMKSMKDYPMVIRVNYAYTLLYKKDVEETKKIKEHFENVAEVYPYLVEINEERKMLKLIDKKYLKMINDKHNK